MKWDFPRIKRLPPYVFAEVIAFKNEARKRGEDIIDMGMGNPDKGSPPHVVEKLVEAARNPKNHRYSVSQGIYKLRVAISEWYKRRYDVDVDPDAEAIVTMGAKEGLTHLMFACLGPGDLAIAPTPTYPIHTYSVVFANADLRTIPITTDTDAFLEQLMQVVRTSWPRPKLLLLSFPHNPTTAVVDLAFYEKVVAFAREHEMIVVSDLAYCDIAFDGYQPPSILQVPGAKDVAVEFISLSKSYNMAGWRVAFCCGNRDVIYALRRIKSYMDYGVFQPVQIAAYWALQGPQEIVKEVRETYRVRRDALCDGLSRVGWEIEKPKGTMFVWAPIPGEYAAMGSVEFAKHLIQHAKVAVSPGVGFGEGGDAFVRFALIENEQRVRQAVRGIKGVL
ncbi:MAG: aminotransferase class I/II-fold pyridoxal phosphate-dependent enzyme [Candidatus Methylomirabilis sp.]|nr:aminotransferase class I/II-fold pyridoxal phosphate-dependent enzyme [Deltaproteobacteria bacterium]